MRKIRTCIAEADALGWVMDDERLKRGTYLTDKYFDEQLELEEKAKK